MIPAAEKIRTVLVSGLDAGDGVKVMTEALASPYDVSAAAYITEEIRNDLSGTRLDKYIDNDRQDEIAKSIQAALLAVRKADKEGKYSSQIARFS